MDGWWPQGYGGLITIEGIVGSQNMLGVVNERQSGWKTSLRVVCLNS